MNGYFFGLAFLAAINPKLFGVDLLLIENRRARAMFVCFLCGGLGLSVTLGLVDVLVVKANAVKTQGTVSAGIDLALGVVLIAVGALIGTGRLHGRRKAAVAAGGPPPKKKEGWAERALREPRLGLAVVVGALSGTPGVTYVTALKHLISGEYSSATRVAGVFVFNLIMFSPVIIPLAFLVFYPEGTKAGLRNVNTWLGHHARQLIAGVAVGVGAYMAISGLLRVV